MKYLSGIFLAVICSVSLARSELTTHQIEFLLSKGVIYVKNSPKASVQINHNDIGKTLLCIEKSVVAKKFEIVINEYFFTLLIGKRDSLTIKCGDSGLSVGEPFI